MKNNLIKILVLTAALASCGTHSHTDENKTTKTPTKETKASARVMNNKVVNTVEKAHKVTDFQSKSDVEFDIELTFGGNKILEGHLTLSTDSRNGKIAYADGSSIVFSDGEVSTSSKEMKASSARFTAYTWPYFFMFPFKLTDPGTIWNSYEKKSLNGTDYLAEKLTFKAGTGDAPDDWYILYADSKTALTHCAAYIVTAGGSSQSDAEQDPHAIEYLDYQLVDGIPMSHEWRFWGWQSDKGLTDQLGFAKISNINFLEVDEGFYAMN